MTFTRNRKKDNFSLILFIIKMKFPKILLILLGFVFIWSAIHPKTYLTWVLEIAPAVVGLILLILTYNRFRFTNMVYLVVFISICLILTGAHYTYSEVPFFNRIKDLFNQSRNNYDKLGHFAQGFLPCLMTREILIRLNVVRNRKWMNFFVLSFCIANSVIYEFVEWGVALIAGGTADEFLGTQGYIWDAQSDMFYATIGAVIALPVFSKVHNKAISRLQKEVL